MTRAKQHGRQGVVCAGTWQPIHVRHTAIADVALIAHCSWQQSTQSAHGQLRYGQRASAFAAGLQPGGHSPQSKHRTRTWGKMKSGTNMVVVKPSMAPHTMSVPRSRRLRVSAAVRSPPTQSAAAYAPFPPAHP